MTSTSSPSAGETSPLLGSTPHKAPPPSTALTTRIAAAMYSFIVTGLFVSSIGVMLPHIRTHYLLTDTSVSLIFLLGPLGYILAASSNALIHQHFGQRGIAYIAPVFHLASAVVLAMHPPFPMLLLAFAGVGLGSAWLDGSWCAWAGGMRRASWASGVLHGSFSAGAAVGPIVAGGMMARAGVEWWGWFWVLAGASAIELVLLPIAFRYEDAARYHAEDQKQHDDTAKDVSPPSSPPRAPFQTESSDPIEALSAPPSHTRAIFSHTATPLSALYCLLYVGTETAISGWIVSYLSRSRHASPFLSALSSSSFWGGMVLGRVALGLVSERLGVRTANIVYLLLAITLQLILALGTLPPAVCVALVAGVGFLMGPLYPGGVVLLTQLVPRGLHVAVVSFVGSVGQAGGALFPFLIGAMVERVGIEVFQYVLVVLLTGALGVWLVFAKLKVER